MKFTVTYSKLINLGNFNNERIELTREFSEDAYPGYTPDDLYLYAFKEVSRDVEKMAALQQAERDARNAARQDLPF